MAECAVTLAIQKLELLDFAENIWFNVTSIMDEFKSMQVLLKDADKESETDEGVKVWVTTLRHAAFEVEDLIEEYVFELHKERPVQEPTGTCRSIRRIKKFFNLPLMRRGRRSLGARFQDIRVEIQNISKSKERYNFAVTQDTTLVDTAHTVVRDARQDALFLDEDQLVGIDGPKEEFIRWLVEEPDPRLGVASVCGMGGVGKTTLVKKVQESHKVRAHFDILGWVTVSENYQAERVLRDLISSILEEEKEMHMDMVAHQLKEMLINLLRSKRYFIVIDDIWGWDEWKGITSALPDSNCGSRIIVTTRFEPTAAASVKNSGYAFQLEPLSPEDSWELFHKVAFRSNGANNEFVDEHLREVGWKFLSKCRGLPVAIVFMVGFLSTKETFGWDTIFRDIESLHQQGKDGISTIFSVIYNDLPCHLKHCLLYLCLFPEDYVIDCSRLLCLWAAEGVFIPRSDEAMTKEKVAKLYLDELIARRLIQVQDIDVWGRVRTCRIHHTFREFILRKAREQDFVQFSSDMEPDNHSIRRLSIANENEDKNIFPKDKRLLHQIQSFFAYGKSSLFNSSTISLFLGGGVKLMKILNLEGVHLKEFPGEILTNLFFLRYLGINAEKFSHPSSLGRLVNLETLVLKGHLLFKLPDEILQLKCLRNLFGDLLKLPEGIGGMTTLEKLNLVVGYDGIDKELGELTQLRSLCMVCVMKKDKSFVLDSIEKMKYLRSLYLRLSKPKINDLDVLDVQHFRFPPLLERLTLIGVMKDVIPYGIFSLKNLTQLKLSYSGLRGYAFWGRLDKHLPKLVELVLEMDAIDVPGLYFWRGRFSKLITLELHGLSKLESIEVVEGAMPCIQNIRFINCPLVKHVPFGIEHLTTLKRIGLANMASNLEDELRSHHWKAGHSPTVKSFADEFEMDSSIVSSFVDELDTAD